jgi:eukaryotic-like serine/threonine-protein kinase
LYEMLTGKKAFDGETITDTLAAVIKEDPDWSRLPANMPVRVRLLLQRCLQKDPKQRLRDIGDARISLDEVLAGAPEPSSAVVAVTSDPAPLWRRALPWATTIALAVVAATFAWAYHRAAHPPVPIANAMRFQIPITSAPAPGGGWFAISPDGRQLAFAATDADGVSRLWVRPLDSLEAHPLSGSESPIFPPFFWSPDSRYIAYNAGGKLNKVEVSSGTAETLCDAPEYVIGGSWNRDGTIIFGSFPGAIMRVSASGGTATPVTALDPSRSDRYHAMPSFLADGRHFIYWRASSSAGSTGIYIGSIDAKPNEQDSKPLLVSDLAAAYAASSDPDSGQLLFMRNGSLMAQPFDARGLQLSGDPVVVAQNVGTYSGVGFFSVSNGGILVYRTASAVASSQLTWFDRQGKALGTAGEPASYQDLALSPDGSKAVAARSNPESHTSAVWTFDFSLGTNTRLTFGFSAVDPIWSPDGNRILFSTTSGGAMDLYQKAANGAADQELLVKSGENKYPSDISRDGRFLLYESHGTKTLGDLWVLPLQGDAKPFPFLLTMSNEIDGHFSPDRRWVAYMSNESSRFEIYVRPFSADVSAPDASGAGPKWQVSYGGGQEPRWSADGKKLYYLTLDWKVMEVDVTASPAFQAGTPRLLFQAPRQRDVVNGNYTVDGKRFLFLAPAGQAGQAQAPFNVVLNWQALLEKQQ